MKPPDGVRTLTGHDPDPNHTVTVGGPIASLDAEPEPFAWNPDGECFELGDRSIAFLGPDPKRYFLYDLGAEPPTCEFGWWS